MKAYYVYMLTNWNNLVMYIGVTNNLEKRVAEHKSRLLPGFTKRYKVSKLVHYEQFGDITLAIEREKKLKAWRREKKNALVTDSNPEWLDLSDGWTEDPSHSFGMTAEKKG